MTDLILEPQEKDLVEVEVVDALKVKVDGTLYGIRTDGDKKKGLKVKDYPKQGIVIPQMGNTSLHVAFQGKENATQIKPKEICLIPGMFGCEAIILMNTNKEGLPVIQAIHNTASSILPKEGLYRAILNRVGGNTSNLKGLKELLHINLSPQFTRTIEFEKLTNNIEQRKLFDKVVVVSAYPAILGNIMRRYCENVHMITTPVGIKDLNKQYGFRNLWLYNNGLSLDYIYEYEHNDNKSIKGEFTFPDPEA